MHEWKSILAFWGSITLLVFVMMGCATFDTAVQVGTTKATDAADRTYNGGKWFVCNGASIGSVRRNEKGNEAAYIEYCGPGSGKVLK